jgi:hexosaminidase
MQKQNELVETYASYYKTIYSDVKNKGLSAVIYTQLTDVETECNGLLTYDREVSKIDAKTAYGINKNLFLDSPVIDPGEGLINKNDKITITASPGLEIRYTLDGSEPGRQSQLYTWPLSFKENQEISAKTFNESSESLTVKATLIGTDRIKPIYSQPFSRKYSAGGYYALCDGITGSKEYTDGKWQGFSGVSPEIMFTLPSGSIVSEISMQLLKNQRAWIFFPRKVSVSVSVDGEKWKQLPDVNFTIKKSEKMTEVKEIKFPCNTPDIHFVKVKFDAIGNCPDWHTGKGNPAWIFVDEIETN